MENNIPTLYILQRDSSVVKSAKGFNYFRPFCPKNIKHLSSDCHDNNRGDFGRRCTKIVRARGLFPANFAFRCFANYNFKDVKFSAL